METRTDRRKPTVSMVRSGLCLCEFLFLFLLSTVFPFLLSYKRSNVIPQNPVLNEIIVRGGYNADMPTVYSENHTTFPFLTLPTRISVMGQRVLTSMGSANKTAEGSGSKF